MPSAPHSPHLSIVVTVVGGAAAVRRLLAAIDRQVDAPPLQVLVPWDDTVADVGLLAPLWPAVTFLPLGALPTTAPAGSAAAQHERFDRRRCAGLTAATGSLVAILEDRAPPRPTWAAAMARLHAELPHAAVGGAIECGPDVSLLNWAYYACDFGRFGPPFAPGPRAWISDVNVCYKRRAVDATRDVWTPRFHEPAVHWRLLEQGETLYLSPDPVVEYSADYQGLGRLLPERYHWGRLFGAIRARHAPPLRRLSLLAAAPLLPLVLLARHARTQTARGHAGRFAAALPWLLPMLVAWSAGEAVGAWSRRP